MVKRDLILQRFMPYRLSVTTNLVSSVIASTYQQLFGLSIPEWRLVAVLAEQNELNQHAIGVATRMDKLTVSRASIALEQRQLVERRRDPDDGRAQLLRLSRTGRDLYAAVAPKALELERRIFAGFTPRQLDQLVIVLGRIEAAALAVAAESADEERDQALAASSL